MGEDIPEGTWALSGARFSAEFIVAVPALRTIRASRSQEQDRQQLASFHEAGHFNEFIGSMEVSATNTERVDRG